MLSRVTRLLALVSAPPLQAATVRHVEVLLLQPNVVMVVVITSTGGVSKRRSRSTIRSTRASSHWAGEYLNERVVGAPRLAHASPARSRTGPLAAGARLPRRDPRRVRRGGDDDRRLYVGGAAGLLDELRAEEIGAYRA